MSLSKPIPDYRHSEEFENGRPSGVRGMPIACRVCNRVFFDNVSLVLHFEIHVKDGVRVSGRDVASMRNDQSSWSPCSYSSLARVFQRMNDCLKSRPPPVPSPTDPNLLCIPLMNVSSQPAQTSSSTCPLMCSHTQMVRKQDGGQTYFPGHKNQEIIVISDDEEEDENKSSVEIDLTLKL